MKRAAAALAVVLTVLLEVPLPAAENDDPAALFPRRAEVRAPAEGLARLVLPPEVTGRCRPDLSDVRLFDASGGQVPFLVASGPGRDRPDEARSTEPAEVVDVSREERRTALGPTTFVETYQLIVPPRPDGVASWDLVFAVADERFAAHVELGSDGSWADAGTVFRLASPPAERLRVPVGPRTGAIGLRLTHQERAWIAPRLRFEGRRELLAATPAVVDLAAESTTHRRTTTEVLYPRPPGLVPDGLILESSTGAFSRTVTVWDEGPGAVETPLGRRLLVRLDSVAPVVVNQVPLSPPAGTHLRVVIENGDSPPLSDLRCSVRVDQPVLLFATSGVATPLTLAFGGGRALPPRYDLAALASAQGMPDTPGATATMLDPDQSSPASLGPVETNPLYDPEPLLAFAQRPAARLDVRGFSHHRSVSLEPSQEGLSRIDLAPDDLAVARADLGDLRLVDHTDRQWPYLVVEADRTVQVPARVERAGVNAGQSRYTFTPASGPLTPDVIQFDVDAPFFDRAFRLEGETGDGSSVVLASGRLQRRPPDPRPRTLSLRPARLVRLEMVVEDGDDAPLRISEAVFSQMVPGVFTVGVSGGYRLLLGYPELEAPNYELERVRPVVLSVPARPAELGPLEDNPDFSRTARLAGSSAGRKVVVWVLLGIVIAILTGLTLRLARTGAS